MKRWQTIAKLIVTMIIVLVAVSWSGIDSAAHAAFWGRSRTANTPQTVKTTGKIAEASPPIALQELRQALDNYQPQVTILSPRRNDVLPDTTVSVRFLVKDLPLFKNETFGLGPHLHVLLDNRPYQAVYDASQPLVFNNLEPGTHTIRAFASRPWHESFKNEGAFAQTTFHVFTKTQNNSPDPELPLLTYSRPQGTYGAEPILLDFYLTNAPLHLVAQADTTDDIADWRIRCTVNGDSFVIDRWQPLYLKGFKPGQNWVQLEYLDDTGNPVQNVFNNTVRLVDYQPNGNDTLAKLTRGDLTAADVRGIVDPNYVPPTPEASPEASPEAGSEPTPESSPESSPEFVPAPIVEEPIPAPSSEASPESAPGQLAPSLKAPRPEPAPDSESSDRPSPIASPPSASSEPFTTPSPEPTLEPLTEPSPSIPETAVPSKPEAAQDENLKLAFPATDETQLPLLPRRSVSPKSATSDDLTKPSGQGRLRQLRQRLGQYLPQRSAIAPSSSKESHHSKQSPDVEPAPFPEVFIPDSLPPTLPEIINTALPEPPAAGKPESSAPGLSEGDTTIAE